jgi:TPP-dependent pyruvate/acetoin dehydrogenase alpha subunit
MIINYKSAFKKILLIRRIEEFILYEFQKNKIFSFLHLSIGQEAVAVGVAMATHRNDFFFGNHRSHHHYLAKGGNITKMIYEIFGDSRGCCGGLGGSMHLIDKNVNFQGSVPILGSAISIASGMAMSKKLEKKNSIVVVFIGDGSAEEGSFYETVNMAGLYNLPLLVIVEDNKYAVESGHKNRKAKDYEIKKVAEGLGAIYEKCDGQDFGEVYKKTIKMRKNIIKKKRVGILHLECLRFARHSGAHLSKQDQISKYRVAKEHIMIKKNDPLEIIETKYLKMKNQKFQNYRLKLEYKIKKSFYNVFKKITLKKI